MFLVVLRSRIVIPLGLVATAAAAPAIGASASAAPPTASAFRAAVAKAERSRGLWATVNICNTKKHRNMIGIRGQIPALGFRSTMKMVVELEYYSVVSGRFKPVPHSKSTAGAGTASSGFRQEGVSFRVTPPAVLSATIAFTWRVNAHLVATTTRRTRQGIIGVQQSDPAGYSAADCRIGE
jgi:hypothetical protein